MRRRGIVLLGGAMTLIMAIEVMFRLAKVVGINAPEGTVSAVNLHILGDQGYRMAVYLLSFLLAIACWRAFYTSRPKPVFRYAVGALLIKTVVGIFRDAVCMAMDMLGIEGGADSLVSTDGYLVRMIEPTVEIVALALEIVFSVAYVCAFFATVSSLFEANGKTYGAESIVVDSEDGNKGISTRDGDGIR